MTREELYAIVRTLLIRDCGFNEWKAEAYLKDSGMPRVLEHIVVQWFLSDAQADEAAEIRHQLQHLNEHGHLDVK